MVDEPVSDEEKLEHTLWEFLLEDALGIAHIQRIRNESDEELRERYVHKKMKAWRFTE